MGFSNERVSGKLNFIYYGRLWQPEGLYSSCRVPEYKLKDLYSGSRGTVVSGLIHA